VCECGTAIVGEGNKLGIDLIKITGIAEVARRIVRNVVAIRNDHALTSTVSARRVVRKDRVLYGHFAIVRDSAATCLSGIPEDRRIREAQGTSVQQTAAGRIEDDMVGADGAVHDGGGSVVCDSAPVFVGDIVVYCAVQEH